MPTQSDLPTRGGHLARSCAGVQVGNIIGFVIKAALFDFGGVVTTSPFEAFASYEKGNGLPDGLIRSINSTNPNDNAWAKLERSDVDARRLRRVVRGRGAPARSRRQRPAVLGLLSGSVRPQMVEAIRRIKAADFITACLTNNFRSHAETRNDSERSETAPVMAMFDAVIESAVVGIRKPEPAFYRKALESRWRRGVRGGLHR